MENEKNKTLKQKFLFPFFPRLLFESDEWRITPATSMGGRERGECHRSQLKEPSLRMMFQNNTNKKLFHSNLEFFVHQKWLKIFL